jgi:hypothetical protein
VLFPPLFVSLALYGSAYAADDLAYFFGLLEELGESLLGEIPGVRRQ